MLDTKGMNGEGGWFTPSPQPRLTTLRRNLSGTPEEATRSQTCSRRVGLEEGKICFRVFPRNCKQRIKSSKGGNVPETNRKEKKYGSFRRVFNLQDTNELRREHLRTGNCFGDTGHFLESGAFLEHFAKTHHFQFLPQIDKPARKKKPKKM